MRITVTVDGTTYTDDVEPRLLLVHYLRDRLGKVGTVVGCDTSNCGACTVHLNGHSVKSCSVLAVQADGARRHHGRGPGPRRQAAPGPGGVPRQPRAAVRLLHARHDHAVHRPARGEPRPDEERVRQGLEGNLCRCTGYQNIVRAVQAAAQRLRGDHGMTEHAASRCSEPTRQEACDDRHRPTRDRQGRGCARKTRI